MAPTFASFMQFIVVGLHGVRNHLPKCQDVTPRVAFILPAWNEAEVLGASIDSLMRMDYPPGAWRIYVVDDASTDDTPALMQRKMAEYPGSVFHLRRRAGGEGKAHTINFGLRGILAEDWAEAVMIMDADVLFETSALRRMTRHLADPEIGAVTAYIKEGSHPGNFVTRFIAFEYITAQAAARRAQTVTGAMACLAGGAQLHTRENLAALGGTIDTSTLAEDTFATLITQLQGRRAIFEGNAIVWAEEPGTLTALWKQRMRWARGNLQLTYAFRDLWFRPKKHAGLGSFYFGIIWFGVVCMPLCMLCSSIGLTGLFLMGSGGLAWYGFRIFWGVTLGVYVFETLFSFFIDPATAKRAWFEGIMFPGIISLLLMTLLLLPGHIVARLTTAPDSAWQTTLILAIYAWTALNMAAAWAAYRLEKAGAPGWVRNVILLLVGYGAVICTVALAAMIAQLRRADVKWDKTIKSGKARIQP